MPTIRNRWFTVAGGAGFGLAGTLAAVTRPSSRWYDAVPSLLAPATAVGVLQLLLAAGRVG